MAQLDDAEIRTRIKQARLEAGLSQTKMAELLGVIPRSVQNYENHHVPWGRIRDIAEITGTTTRWLLHGDETGGAEPSGDVLTALAQLDTKLDRLLVLSGAEAPSDEPSGEEGEEAAPVVADVSARLATAAGSRRKKAPAQPKSHPAATRRRRA